MWHCVTFRDVSAIFPVLPSQNDQKIQEFKRNTPLKVLGIAGKQNLAACQKFLAKKVSQYVNLCCVSFLDDKKMATKFLPYTMSLPYCQMLCIISFEEWGTPCPWIVIRIKVNLRQPSAQCCQIIYGKFFFSSNTLAVRTPKIILKLLLKTFSFSSNSDYFHVFEFLILRTLKNARNNAWTSQPCQIFGCFVFPPTPWAKRDNSIVSMCGVLLGLKVICRQAKNIL